MTEIPHGVLSEHFQNIINGRKVIAGVFLTYKFDPQFFEQYVLPVILDIPLSHVSQIKLVQLEDALQSIKDGIAVYYDQNGLEQKGSSRLDIQRIPVRYKTGIFHPKNVFLLLEETDEEGQKIQSLIISCLSANLTEAGWWRNVEVCHTEEINEGDLTRLREDLKTLFDTIVNNVGDRVSDDHKALRSIRAFLRKTDQREKRSTDGLLHTHFFDGRGTFPDFLYDATAGSLQGMYLEIISPYLDAGPELKPLIELIEKFNPKEVRVFLPHEVTGQASCSKEVFKWVREQPNVLWGHLPKNILQLGKGENFGQRFVHAKVYRFFLQNPKTEILFVGSVNLTTAAHQRGGNLETGFLVETLPPRRPEWWLEPIRTSPDSFVEKTSKEENITSRGTRLSIRFYWGSLKSEAYWDDETLSPELYVENNGEQLFKLEPLVPKIWTPLSSAISSTLQRVLKSTSMLSVRGDGEDKGLFLVQEEEMSHRPSLLYDLTAADILKYWSLLTVEQRAAFIEAHSSYLANTDEGLALVTQIPSIVEKDTFFDRFAGIFLSFTCLERKIREDIANENDRGTDYRLFGEKYDSLGNLLTRVMKEQEEEKGETIEHYIIMLCALQMINELRKDYPEFWKNHKHDENALKVRLDSLTILRDKIIAKDQEKMQAFMEWFDSWFLKRAKPVEKENEL